MTDEIRIEAERIGKEWGAEEVKVWRDLERGPMPEWTMGEYSGRLPGNPSSEEHALVVEKVIDLAARAVWEEAREGRLMLVPDTKTFPLGGVMATRGAAALAGEHGIDLRGLVMRHARGDDGDLSAEDKRANTAAIASGARILSAYDLPEGLRFWVITEADRSLTTVLLPEEY